SPQAQVTAIGTMGYAPPELFLGKVVPASDIYSLGATLFHLLTGTSPQSNPVMGLDFAHNPRPIQINPKLTKEMDEIIAKAVETKAADRYSSGAEMKLALEEHLYRLNHPELFASNAATLHIVRCSTNKTATFPLKKDTSVIGRFDADR